MFPKAARNSSSAESQALAGGRVEADDSRAKEEAVRLDALGKVHPVGNAAETLGVHGLSGHAFSLK